MTKLIVATLICISLLGGGLWVKNRVSPYPVCTVEEIQRAMSPDKSLTAIYENEICTETPTVLNTKVFVAAGAALQRVSWQRVFLAQAPLESGVDRPTRPQKLSIKWLDSKTLSINTNPEIKVDSQAAPPENLAVRVLVNNRQSISAEEVAKLVEGENDELRVLHTYLKFIDDERIRSDAFALLYRNFGKQKFLPTVDALWNLTTSEHPQFAWQAIKEPSVRLEVAALWGQWHREFLKDPLSAETAAAYVRDNLFSKSPEIRLEAIGALGSVGSLDDRRMLTDLVLGADKQAALRATSAILAIERAAKANESVLPGLASRVTNEEIRARIFELVEKQKIGIR